MNASSGLTWQPSLFDAPSTVWPNTTTGPTRRNTTAEPIGPTTATGSASNSSGDHASGDHAADKFDRASAAQPNPYDHEFDTRFTTSERRDLGSGAWVEYSPDWLHTSDMLFEQLLRTAPWFDEPARVMYDKLVAVPRLTTGIWDRDRPPILDAMSAKLSSRYEVDLVSISANLYRDGRDSVAWHGDQVGAARTTTIVAIVSLGSPRKLLLRPDGGGPSVGYMFHSGDLLVQGGTCQRTHQHCVPKRANAGPRISVMFRELHGH